MTLDQMIAKLQALQPKCGKFKVSTWDGFIVDLRMDTCKDGVVNTDPAEHNELSIDVVTE